MTVSRPRTLRIVVGTSIACVLAGWIGLRDRATPEVTTTPAAPAVLTAQPLATQDLPTQVQSTSKAKPVVSLFAAQGATRGSKLAPSSPASIRALREGKKLEGRSTELDPKSFLALTTVSEGDKVRIPLTDSESVSGTVQLVQHDRGNYRVSGRLEGSQGTFVMSTEGSKVAGLVQLPRQQLAYLVEQKDASAPVLREVSRADVVCAPLPRFEEPQAAAAANPGPVMAPPILSSRPDVTAVLYLDFDGETVTDPAWNGGATIVAPPHNLSNNQIVDIFNRVKEDFWPFNVDVTTDVARYNSAPVGQRMRCIMTPNDAAGPGSGGVAYINSFSNAGGGFFRADIPCWVFNGGVVGISEAISHEIGHTLGLGHDGRNSPQEEYYGGHGNGPTGWAPIMGVGYSRNLVQWSKGEYNNANNQQQDVELIARPQNSFGYVPDEAGGDVGTAAEIAFNADREVEQIGVISRTPTGEADLDYFQFGTTGGNVTLSAEPAAVSPNLDIALEIRDSNNTLIQTGTSAGALDASVTANCPPGTYYLVVRSTGEGAVSGTGYSNYGSLGAYTVTGTIPGGIPGPPDIVSLAAVSGEVGIQFRYLIRGTYSPTSYGVVGTLPPGLTVNAGTGVISGVPTTLGTYTFDVTATNFAGTGSKTVTVTVNPQSPPNLRVAPRLGWQFGIVISSVAGNSADATVIDADDPVFVDFAVVNSGTLPAGNTFSNRLYVDNVLIGTYDVAPPLARGEFASVLDVAIGSLSEGTHTIRVEADVNNTVTEGNEGDNVLERTINVVAPRLTNLEANTPPGWSDSIVISSRKSTNVDGPSFFDTSNLYVDFAIRNTGPADVSSPFAIEVYLDDVLHSTIIRTPPFGPGIIIFEQDLNLGRLAVGEHTIRIKVDATDSVLELNEGDNEFSRTFSITESVEPNLTFSVPPGWTNKVVVSRVPGTRVDSPLISTVDPVFVSIAATNDGNAPVGSAFTVKVYLNDETTPRLVRSSATAVPAGQVMPFGDVNTSLGTLPAGEHTIRVLLDSEDTVLESNEDDNFFERLVTVANPTLTVGSANFAGLIRPPAGEAVSAGQLGFSSFTVSSKRSFTGKLSVGGTTYRVKGALNDFGDSGFGRNSATPTLILKRRGAAPMVLDFRLGGSAGDEQLVGDITADGLLVGIFRMDRVLYSGAKNPVAPLTAPPAEMIARYTAILPAKTPDVQGIEISQYPQGAGVAFGAIDKSGVLKLAGTLADGTKFSTAAPVVSGNRVPFHAVLDKGAGAVNGFIDIRTQEGIGDFDATNLTWVRGAATSPKVTLYPAGWPAGILVDMVGSKYVRAKKQAAMPWLPAGGSNATLTLSEGALPGGGQTATLSIDAKNKVSVSGGTAANVKLKINAKTGAVTGIFLHPEVKKGKISGAVLDSQQIVGGYFLGGTQAGDATIAPNAAN